MQITCPSCKDTIDLQRAKDVCKNDVKPSVNDFSVCFYCGAIARFNEKLELRSVQPEELVDLNDKDPDFFDHVMKTSATIKHFRSCLK